MFKIYDGRDKFYQWDIDRKLIVEDSTIKEVHFCNRTDNCSLVVDTYDENGLTLADVPNILLQNDFNINVYGFTGNYTKHSEKFEVVRRTKPTDYVYTETEIKSIERAVDEAFQKGIESGELVGPQGEEGRGIKSISYDENIGMNVITYTDGTTQYFGGNSPLTGKYTYFDDKFNYSSATGNLEEDSLYRFNSNVKTASISNGRMVMDAIGSSKTPEDSVGVYHNEGYVSGEAVIEFDFKPTLSNGGNSPFVEVRLFNEKIWCRINRAKLNWFCVSTASGLDIPSTPTGERLSVSYALNTTYRIKIIIEKGKLTIKSWDVSKAEPAEDNKNSIYLVSDLINEQLINEAYKPKIIFGQINAINSPTAQYQCEIDNYVIYKDIVATGNEREFYAIGTSSLTATDKAFLERYYKYYKENNKPLPVDLYYYSKVNNDYCYHRIISERFTPNSRKIVFYCYDTKSENCPVGYQYVFNANDTFNGYAKLASTKAKNWYWVDCYGQTYLQPYNTSHIKVVCCAEDDTNAVFTYDISATNNNIFDDEYNTRYFVAEPFQADRGDVRYYFLNSDVETDMGIDWGLVLMDENGTNYFDGYGIILLGYYYWG